MALPSWAPTAAQVAAILRARTRGPASRDAAVSGEQGLWTTTTRPTLAQVGELIDLACIDMAVALGGRTPCTDELADGARAAATYRAAQLVETSYYPEQTNGDQTAFSALEKMWEDASAAVAAAVIDQCPLTTGGADVDGMPLGRVPDDVLLGRRVVW